MSHISPPQLVDKTFLLSKANLVDPESGLMGVLADLYLPNGSSTEVVTIPLSMTFKDVTDQVRSALRNESLILFADCDPLDDTDCWENCACLVPYRSEDPEQIALHPDTKLYCVEDSVINITVSYSNRTFLLPSLSASYSNLTTSYVSNV